MDGIQQAFAEFVSHEVQENANPYPTAIQAFKAGIQHERKNIITALEHWLVYKGLDQGACMEIQDIIEQGSNFRLVTIGENN